MNLSGCELMKLETERFRSQSSESEEFTGIKLTSDVTILKSGLYTAWSEPNF